MQNNKGVNLKPGSLANAGGMKKAEDVAKKEPSAEIITILEDAPAEPDVLKQEVKVVAFIDVGTNSIRLMVVRINKNQSYNVLLEEKEFVRLGENEFKNNYLQPDAMNRAILVCKKFVELAKTLEASEIIAVATTATREAKNKTEFLDKLKAEANLNVSVVSGNEEASLTYLGVSSGVHIGNKKAIFIDIGGGSTEITIGNQFRQNYVDSLEFGAIRITTTFLPEKINEPVPQQIYDTMKRYIINKMPRTVNTIRNEGIKLAYGSSGTILNLAEISAKMSKKQVSKRNLVLKHKDLEKVVSKLCSLTLDERKKIPGINPERADIIIGGAAILETMMEQFKLDKITVSYRGLIHGMLIDYLSLHEGFADLNEMSVREMSVLMLGRSCNLNEKHANFVTSLALQLFDSSMKIKIHNLGEEERELLKYASFLHDVGDFISFREHTLHSAYIVSNAELLGFKQSEINIMANVVRFHGKKLPAREDSSTAGIDDGYNTIVVLSMLLKLAENLDRSRTGIIKNAEFKPEGGDKVILSIVSAGDCQLEIWGVNENLEAFEDVFKKKIELEIKNIK